jgi:lipopolysaccharide export LptBFGC system permease protein LptF
MARNLLPDGICGQDREFWSRFSRGLSELTFSVIAFSSAAAAQSEQATQICNGTGWNLFLAVLIVFNAMAIMLAITALAVGLTGMSLGGVSSRLKSMGTMTFLLVMAGSLVYLVVASILGVALVAGPINPPEACLLPF